MSKKLSAKEVLNAGASSVDAQMAAADVITPLVPPDKKEEPKSAFDDSHVQKLVKQVRGNVPFEIRGGTLKVLPINGNHPQLNQGGPAEHKNQHFLKIDLEKMKVTK